MPRRLPLLALVFATALATANAQTSRFQYSPERVPVGTVYHYTKSNLDGSNPWRLSTYVASRTRIDVVKWAGEPGQLVNVTAEFNWSSAVAERLEQWNPRDGAMALTMAGELALDGRTLTLALANGQKLAIAADAGPLHVYGFDLQSLNMAYRHLADPTRSFEVGLVGMNRKPSPERPEPVVYFGRTVFEYAGEEQVGGAACRKYRITGPGMDGKPGTAWFDRDAGHLVKIESPWPASDDWTTYRLELDKVERMTPFAWHAFKAGVVAPHVKK